jgi:hypothetical protein
MSKACRPPCQLAARGLVPADLAHKLGLLADAVERALQKRGTQPLGPVIFPDGSYVADAALAARTVLADVEHCIEWVDLVERPISRSRWAELIAQLETLHWLMDEP